MNRHSPSPVTWYCPFVVQCQWDKSLHNFHVIVSIRQSEIGKNFLLSNFLLSKYFRLLWCFMFIESTNASVLNHACMTVMWLHVAFIMLPTLFRLFKLCSVAHPRESKGSPIRSVGSQWVWTKASTGTIQVMGTMWTLFRSLEHISSGNVYDCYSALYCVARSFCLEIIFNPTPLALMGDIFILWMCCPMLMITWSLWWPTPHGKKVYSAECFCNA